VRIIPKRLPSVASSHSNLSFSDEENVVAIRPHKRQMGGSPLSTTVCNLRKGHIALPPKSVRGVLEANPVRTLIAVSKRLKCGFTAAVVTTNALKNVATMRIDQKPQAVINSTHTQFLLSFG
jgi:hypothetical protein